MDICHLKKSELEPNFQKHKGRVVLRRATVKNDSGSYAVFSEQSSSASQMTAAKVMDIISRLPGCAGQAADAASAYTQVKMEDASFLLNEIYMVIREPDCCVKDNSKRKFYWNTVGQKFRIRNVSLYIVKKDYSCLCTWTI